MSELPTGLTDFLDRAGWGGAAIDPIPGDASFRRYFRVSHDGRRAMLMHAPPPHEDPRPFIHVGDWLIDNGMRGPEIYAAEPEEGWVLIEDFGDDRMRDWLDDNPGGEIAAYAEAIDTAVSFSTAIVDQATGILEQIGVARAGAVLAPLVRSSVENALARHDPGAGIDGAATIDGADDGWPTGGAG